MIQNLIFAILFLKILFRAYNFSPHVPVDIIRVFFIPEFVAENLRANKNQQKDHSLYNTVSLKKPHSFYESQLFWNWKQYAPKHSQKTFSVYKFSSKNVSVWCQKIHFHCTISWRPRTTFLKHFESKYLYISVYLSKKFFVSKRFYLVIWGVGGGWIIP